MKDVIVNDLVEIYNNLPASIISRLCLVMDSSANLNEIDWKLSSEFGASQLANRLIQLKQNNLLDSKDIVLVFLR